MRKGNGQEARLSFSLHGLMENRCGLLTDFRVGLATGTAERDLAEEMLWAVPGAHRITIGAGKAYDTKDFVAACSELGATPNVAQNVTERRGSAIDGRQPGTQATRSASDPGGSSRASSVG